MISNEITLQKFQMAQKLPTVSHHMTFTNKESPYRIVKY